MVGSRNKKSSRELTRKGPLYPWHKVAADLDGVSSSYSLHSPQGILQIQDVWSGGEKIILEVFDKISPLLVLPEEVETFSIRETRREHYQESHRV